MKCYNRNCDKYLLGTTSSGTLVNCKVHSIGSIDGCTDFISNEMICHKKECIRYHDNFIINCMVHDDLKNCSEHAYPKSATFLEAVKWMELGNKAICPHGEVIELKKSKYDKRNEFAIIKKEGYYRLVFVDIKEEWQLLAPEKTEEPKELNTIMCPKCFIVSINRAHTNYCCQCGNYFHSDLITTEEIRKELTKVEPFIYRVRCKKYRNRS